MNRGFGRRLLGVFVLCTMLPLALSDWLATSALASIARELHGRQQAASVRQTSLQVLDRLIVARALLVGIAAQPGAPLPSAASRVFEQMAGADARHVGATMLLRDWARARPAMLRAPTPDGDAPPVTLRTLAGAAGNARVFLGTGAPDQPRWVAELRPDHLWAPLAETADPQAWRVTDSRDLRLDRSASEPVGARPGHGITHATALFLAAEFGADDWTFAVTSAAASPDWQGVSLTGWLALVTLAAALMTVLLGVWLLRGTLGPLQRLTDGTRALAGGDVTTRVRIAGDDEFAQLGAAFNDMAGRMDAQIRSLELLASIDRDVLSGTDSVGVARSVLSRFAAVQPTLDLAVAWHDVGQGPERGFGAVAVRRRANLMPGDPGAIEVVQPAADPSDPDALVAELFAADPARPVRRRPLTWGGRHRGWFVVAATPAEHAAIARLADELSDRLAVAISAREREAEMAWRASHDGLTGLANRHGLHAVVDRLLAGGTPFAVLFVDLDRFKDANDTLGHEVGDRVLCEAARRLERCAPVGATVARQGGDEFVLLLPNAGRAEADELASEVVRALSLPFALGSEPHRFGASVGVALAPDDGADRHVLLRRADTAMYAAKAAGRGRHMAFDATFEIAAQTRMRLPAELRRALEQGELVAYFQPRVDAASGTVASAEALVRWQHPERGLVLPQDFIPLAEESQLIEDIGRFMLDVACRNAARWRRSGALTGRVSVNVSPRQLVSGRLIDDVRGALTRHGLPPEALELEITEGLIVADPQGARLQLGELRRSGVTVALDDFGSGYSSMSSLRDLPIDVMKIDRAFVRDLGHQEGALAVARAIATLGLDLRLTLVAEGVETDEQADILRHLGCHELQGYRYARPMPDEAFEAFATALGGSPGRGDAPETGAGGRSAPLQVVDVLPVA